MRFLYIISLFILEIACNNPPSQSTPSFASVAAETPDLKTVKDIPPPKSYERSQNTEEPSFGSFLRNIALKKDKTVYLYNGEKKRNQAAQYMVLDVSVGTRDLQQCADAIMRLRGEFLFKQKAYNQISFKSVDGKVMRYVNWANGSRNLLKPQDLKATLKTSADISYPTFLKYMDFVFAYASTLSLEKEMKPVAKISDIKIGDVFIKGGAPGHAIIVMDLATQKKTGKKVFLLAQSYMPAQDIHILVNPNDSKMSPWYAEDFENQLITPEWDFEKGSLRHF
jgi:Domain of unknown function (4846)